MRPFAVLLMIAFACYAFYPVGAVIWFHANRAEIASTLCENKDLPKLKCRGNCVLNKKVNQKENPESSAPSLQKWVETVAFPPADREAPVNIAVVCTTLSDLPPQHYTFLFAEQVFRPPVS